MEARLARAALLAAALLSLGAQFRTPNFVVDASQPDVARQVGSTAEKYRRELAVLWLGKAMPNWSRPCPIKVRVGRNLGAGGVTSFLFDRGEVFGWRMTIQGPQDRLLDSVLPHEVTHTIFASHFRQPLPRWADEGACTTVEHASERAKQQDMLIQFLKTGRGIPFSSMFAMKEYPGDVMPLYSQGFSLASFLINQGGRQKFLDYVAQGLKQERWAEVTKRTYGYAGLAALQDSWLDWVKQGSPIGKPAPDDSGTPLAAAESTGAARPASNVIYRGQSQDPPSEFAGNLVPVRPRSVPSTEESSGTGPLRKNVLQEMTVSDEQPDASTGSPSKPGWHSASGARSHGPARRSRDTLLEWSRDAAAPEGEVTGGDSVAPLYDASAGEVRVLR